MTTSAILQRAKQELLTRGWCQGHAMSARGEVCTLGALGRVVGGGRVLGIADVLSEMMGIESIVLWNDAPWRTPEHVLNLFDAAIAQAQRDEAACVPAAAVDAPASPMRGLPVTTHPSGGDRATSSSASSSVLVGDSSW